VSATAADRRPRDGRDGNGADAIQRGKARAEGRAPRARSARTPSTSARIDTRSARAAKSVAGRSRPRRARRAPPPSRPRAWNQGEGAAQLAGERRERRAQRTGSTDDDEGRVTGRGVARRAVCLTQPPARPIALDGPADLATHGKARPARLCRRAPEYDHRRSVDSFATLEECLELGARSQPLTTREPARQTVSRFRPFARRRLSTFRPPLVFIRSRKP
jgi:hypothetical protein